MLHCTMKSFTGKTVKLKHILFARNLLLKMPTTRGNAQGSQLIYKTAFNEENHFS